MPRKTKSLLMARPGSKAKKLSKFPKDRTTSPMKSPVSKKRITSNENKKIFQNETITSVGHASFSDGKKNPVTKDNLKVNVSEDVDKDVDIDNSFDVEDAVFGAGVGIDLHNLESHHLKLNGKNRRKSVTFSIPSPTKAIKSPVKKAEKVAQEGADGLLSASRVPMLEELRQKFQQLTLLRTTAAEKLLEDYKKRSNQQIEAAERLIESLRRENECLRAQVVTTDNFVKGSRRLSDISSASMGLFDSNQASSLLSFYETLSGIRVQPEEGSPSLWHCSIRGRQGEFTFDLELDEAEQQYCYKPTFSPDSAMVTRLPAYLQEEIAFDCDQLQLFFWRALNFLMSTSK